MSDRAPSALECFHVDRAGYTREGWLYERALWAVAGYRLGNWLDARFSPWLGVRPAWLRYLVKIPLLVLQRLLEAFTGVELPPQTAVGPGLRIWHGGNIVINPRTRIGANCMLRQGVTVGNVIPNGPVPVIGDRVELGAYAQVLGEITIGDDARIGAMSVVLQDVPSGATAVGIPARIIRAREQGVESEVDPV